MLWKVRSMTPNREVVLTIDMMIMMPLFPVCDRDPVLPSPRPLEIVLSTGQSLSMTKASGLRQGHLWWGRDGPQKEGVGLPKGLPASLT